MSRLAFLLGAGASFPYGIPMMRQFYLGFSEYIGSQRAHCRPLLDNLSSGMDGIPDLESLIQRLEQVRTIRSGLAALGLDNAELVARIDLADELRGYLDAYLIETCESFDRERVKVEFKGLVTLASAHSATVFTTNYDRLIETAAAAAGISFADGFEPMTSRPEARWNGTFSHALKLVKLHGSVSWYQEEGSGEVFRLERGYPLPSHEYRLTHGNRALRPLMIIPTLEKAILSVPYATLFTQFTDTLRDTDLLFVIGNSLRDEHLRNTIRERASNLHIVLVNPAAVSQTSIIGWPQSTHALPLRTEQFLRLGLSSLGDLMEALRESTDVDTRRSAVAAYCAQVAELAAQLDGMSIDEQQWLNDLRSAPAGGRLEALRRISSPAHPALVKEIIALSLRSGEEAVRIASIDKLADIQGEGSVETLVKVATGDGALPVRAEAVLALRSMNGTVATEAVQHLRSTLSADTSLAPLFRHGS
jgi:NAD-dependent SIR2 family protein deacetylase